MSAVKPNSKREEHGPFSVGVGFSHCFGDQSLNFHAATLLLASLATMKWLVSDQACVAIVLKLSRSLGAPQKREKACLPRPLNQNPGSQPQPPFNTHRKRRADSPLDSGAERQNS